MTVQRLTVNHVVLPDGLLPSIKDHLRVRHTRDDALITNYIAAAISIVERKCNVCLDPATYQCTADEARRWGCRPGSRAPTYLLPVNNVVTATISDDWIPPTDYTDSFELWNPDPGGNGSSFLVGLSDVGLDGTWLIDLEVGMDDPQDLAPAFFALVARMTGGIYENRESSSSLWADTWDAELMGLWRPTA